MPRFLTAAELEQAQEQLPDEKWVAWLIAATNDWPTFGLAEPANLVAELRAEVGPLLTYEALEKRYVDVSRDAWKMEAVSSLLRLFAPQAAAAPLQDLETLLDELTACVRSRLRDRQL